MLSSPSTDKWTEWTEWSRGVEKLIRLGTIDVRYIVVIAILLAAIWAIRKWPNLAVPLTIGLGAAGLAYTILFH